MELTKHGDNSIKIKLKKLTIVTDPEKKTEAEAAIVTVGVPPKTLYEEYPLVIEGPGEYEKNGVYIKGEKVGDGVTYEIIDGAKIHLAPSSSLEKFKEEDDIDVLIVKTMSVVDESIFSSFSSSIVVLYGPSEHITIKSESIKKLNKVNLKNKDELIGSVIVLES